MHVKLSKYHWAAQQVQYLGHIVSTKGVGTASHVCKAVLDFPEPKDKVSIQRFLGLTNYYNRFIYDYSQIAKPLWDVTIHYNWSDEQKSAFQALKTLLT